MTDRYIPVSLLLFTSLILILCSKDFILFWDTIQFGGKHSLYFFENLLSAENPRLSDFLLPSSIDSGHCPVFGLYLASVWKIFGKTLMITHVAMGPFIFLALLFAYRIGRFWKMKPYTALVLPLVLLLIPQSASQMMLVSPDVVLVACFLGTLYALLSGNYSMLWPVALSLGLISNRGAILLFILVLWHIIHSPQHRRLNRLKSTIPAIFALFIVVGYHIFHGLVQGWLAYSAEMPWAESFRVVSLSEAFRNAGFLIWRLVDFGVIFIWIGLVLQFGQNKSIFLRSRIFWLLCMLIVVFAVMTIPFSGLMQHRYFLPIYILAGFLFIRNLLNSSFSLGSLKLNYAVALLVGLGLICGNFWIYPNKISQGWDSTLAHVPYYSIFEEMTDLIEERGISLSEVGTGFPMRSPFRELFLNEDLRQYDRKEINSQDYILWSNINNDFPLQEINILNQEWERSITLKEGGVTMILYKKGKG